MLQDGFNICLHLSKHLFLKRFFTSLFKFSLKIYFLLCGVSELCLYNSYFIAKVHVIELTFSFLSKIILQATFQLNN